MHLGHQKLLSKMRNLAKKHDLHSVLITYDQHPRYTLAHNRDFAILSPTLEKLQLLKSCGIDHIEVLPFTPELAQESAQKFLSGYILPNYSPKLFILGHDSHFGHNRSGNYRFLKRQEEIGIQCSSDNSSVP